MNIPQHHSVYMQKMRDQSPSSSAGKAGSATGGSATSSSTAAFLTLQQQQAQQQQPYWMRRNMALIRGRNALDEGCYAEILCNYQVLSTELKAAQSAGVSSSSAAIRSRQAAVYSYDASTTNSTRFDAGKDDAGEGRKTINNFTRGEIHYDPTANSNATQQNFRQQQHSDVHATIRELSNELDRAQSELQEKNQLLNSVKANRDRLESQVAELSGKLANAALANNKMQRDSDKREEMINILKNEREAFMSENETLRKKLSSALREASKYRDDLMSWKEVEIGLRQQVFELESLVAAIRRGEADDVMMPLEEFLATEAGKGGGSGGASAATSSSTAAAAPAKGSPGRPPSPGFVDVSPSDGKSTNDAEMLAATAAAQAAAASTTNRSRFNSFIDNFLGFGKPYNAATHNAQLQQEALQKQMRDQMNEATFTEQTAAFLGTDVAKGHSVVATIPTLASFVVERAHEGDLQALCFTETAKHLWTGGAEKAIKCWDVGGNGRLVVRIPCSGGFPQSLNSVGELLAVGCGDSTIRVFETSRYRDRCQLTGHSDKVTTVQLAPDAVRLFSTATDRTIKRWAVNRETLENTIMCVSGCNDIALMNDKLASAHHDGTVRLWDTRDCRPSGEIKFAHEKAIATVRWVGDSMQVASLGRDDCIQISDIRTLRVIHTIRDAQLRAFSNTQRFDISVDGRYLCIGGSSGSLLFFNTDSGALAQPTNTAPRTINGAHAGYIMNVAWNPEGKGVATVGSDKKLGYWR